MSNCTQCGVEIPKAQTICSMCMGDINHGSDEYYKEYMADMEAAHAQAMYEAEQNAQGQAECDAQQHE